MEAQGLEAERLVVMGPMPGVDARKVAQPALQRFVGHPGCRQPARTRLERGRARLERLPGQPERVDGPIELRAERLERQGPRLARNVESRTPPRRDCSLRDETFIGVNHRRFGHVHLDREIAHGGQPRPGREPPAGNAGRDGGHDLADAR